MSFIEIFKASVHEVSRNNRFLVWLPGMPPDLVLHCINANIPGESFSSNLNYDPQIGSNVIPWEMPYDIVQNECQLTFMLDPFYRIKRFFDDWIKEVYDSKTGFGYLDDYAKDAKVFQLTRQNFPSYTSTLTKAWPKQVSDINFDAASQNQPAVFTVSLVYGEHEKG